MPPFGIKYDTNTTGRDGECYMIKQALRQEYLACRKALPADEVERRSQWIAEQFMAFLQTQNLVSIRVLHTFLPIRRQNEVSTWPIIHSLWKNYPSIQLAVSVADQATNSLTHYPLTHSTVLIDNKWGIPEPDTNNELPIDSRQIDLVLVPLLVFDRQGQRVGYGGGYYDRFLAECHPNCHKIGLSLFQPVDLIDNILDTDIPLTASITPSQTYVFD